MQRLFFTVPLILGGCETRSNVETAFAFLLIVAGIGRLLVERD